MEKFKNLFLHSPGRYIISFVIALALALIYLNLYGFSTKINYINGLFIGGGVTFLIGGLSAVSYYGGFDIIGYGFSTIKKDGKGKYIDLFDYINKKKIERKKMNFPFIPYFTIGFFFVLISFILNIVFY
jgi:hypothetical protein